MAASPFGNSVTARPTMWRIRSAVVRSAIGSGDDVPPVAQDGGPVAQLEDLVEAVAHEEDGDAAVAGAADDREEALDLVGRERRGRLVEDEDPGVEGERLGDLDELLVGHRQAAHRRGHVEPDVQLLEDARRPAPHLAPGDRSQAARRRAREEDVLRDREVREEPGLLVDDGDARARVRPRGSGCALPHRRAGSSRRPERGRRQGSSRACSCRRRSRRRARGSRRAAAPSTRPRGPAVAPNRFEIPRSSRLSGWRGVRAAGSVTVASGRHAVARLMPGSLAPSRAGVNASAGVPTEMHQDPHPAQRGHHVARRLVSVRTAVIRSVRQNVAEASRPHFVWSTTAYDLACAAPTMERLIWASSSIASERPASIENPAAPTNAFWTFTARKTSDPERPDDRQRLPADAAAEHQDGDAGMAGQLRGDPDAVGHDRQPVPRARFS